MSGGRNKLSRELRAIRHRLSDLADDVLSGRTEKGVAAVASQVIKLYLRAISVQLKVVEQRLIERMEELEAVMERQNGRKGSGAYG